MSFSTHISSFGAVFIVGIASLGLVAGCGGDDETPAPAAANSSDNGGGGKEDRTCVNGKPCGNTCIAMDKMCNIEPNNGGGDNAFTGEPACASVGDDSGRGLSPGFHTQLNDPLANFVLKAGDGCPTDFGSIMEKLRKTDTEDCEDGGTDGISTMMVSERSQILDEPAGGRVVVKRVCGGREDHELLFSMFASADEVSEGNVEVMAFDADRKVFNYYSANGGGWTFHGDSTDLISSHGEERGCANCHLNGGLIMKELPSPWMHWEGHTDTPGASDLIDSSDDLGRQDDGITMEFLVDSGNRSWNEARVEFLKGHANPRELLKPIFCPTEYHVENGGQFPGDSAEFASSGLFVDPIYPGFFSSPDMDPDAHDEAIAANNQRIEDGRGNKIGDHRDTIFAFPHIVRGSSDSDYVSKLDNAGIVDDELLKDILIIDFTAALHSETRCGLLGRVPTSVSGELTADNIRSEMIKSLAGSEAGTVEGELLANLEKDNGAEHDATIETYFDACNARPSDEMTADMVKLASQGRNFARSLHLFEFAEALPVDDLNLSSSARMNPETCVFEP